MNKTYSILRTHLTTTPCPFVCNSNLRNLLIVRQFSDKKDPPKQRKKSEQEGCNLCEEIFKQCDRCPEALSRPECEKNVPGCMPFTEDVPMPQPQPQFTEDCLIPECANDCKRRGPPRCPRPQSDTSPPENEEHKTTEHCEDKKKVTKKPDGCK